LKGMENKKREKPPELVLPCGLKVKHTYSEGRETNWLHMTMGDTSAKVVNGKKEIGSVNACLGGGIEIVAGKETWTVGYIDLWQFVCSQLGLKTK
jgi:hypothetical protein